MLQTCRGPGKGGGAAWDDAGLLEPPEASGGFVPHPLRPQRCQELRWCPRGPQCFLGCRFARAVLRRRLCPDPSPGDPEAPRSLMSPFPGGRGSQGEVIHGATEQKSGADGHSVSQAWVPRVERVASPGSMHDTGCLGLVQWDDP